jgi:ATP-binding cassette subfamily G (WHITE) protein 2 (PDR)
VLRPIMAGLLSDGEGFTLTPLNSQPESHNANSRLAQSSFTGVQTQSTNHSGTLGHTDGIHRTASGRETYHPDGHVPGNKPFCEHDDAIASTATHSKTHERKLEEVMLMEPATKLGSSLSSDPSTRFGSNGQRHEKKRRESSISDSSSSGGDTQGHPALERRATRAEIDDEGRRELQRILTTHSQKLGRQISIAQPGDPAVDPSSEAFDLSKFLKMFRHNLEGEGVEMKKLSVVYKNLNVFGSGKALQLQSTVSDIFMLPFRASEYFGKSDRKQILHEFDGIIKAGELCIVLGRPGSGCSTLLKTLTGELHGLDTDKSVIHYNGIPQNKMVKEFKGETVYNQEVDKHFPHLTVGQTLEHAAALKTPSNRPMGVSREEFSKFITQVVMAVLGLSHTYNTKVGDDFVRGVSGGERKRVSVAEMLLAGAPFASWDNSTRGLDSATALKFVKVKAS